MKKLVPLVCLLALGCGDDDRGGTDSGFTLMDTGTRDSGLPPMMDAGGGTDAGGGGTDGGGTRACEEMLPALPAEALPRCSADTLTCIMGCGADGACQFACTMEDTTPPVDLGGTTADCSFCWNYQTLYCLDSQGCHDQLAAFFCCVEDNGCADPNNCPACNAQLTAVQGCTPSGGCNDALLSCFP